MNIKPKIFLCVSSLFIFAACSDTPSRLSNQTETIEVTYVNWACNCADFIELKYSENNPGYETKEDDCIYIEPARPELKLPETYFYELHFEKNLRLTGQFYVDKGVPLSYDQKTPEKPEKARVFRYERIEYISK